jgi:uncharacterized protein YbjT (DUF2867 family)
MMTTTTLDHLLTNLTLDVTRAALAAGAGYTTQAVMTSLNLPPSPYAKACTAMWEAMTGLDPETANALATHILGHRDQVTAAVVPL